MVSEFLPYAEGGVGVASTVRAARRSSTMKETVSGNASLVQWWSHLDAFSVGGRIIKGRVRRVCFWISWQAYFLCYRSGDPLMVPPTRTSPGPSPPSTWSPLELR